MELRTLKCKHGVPIDVECQQCEEEGKKRKKNLRSFLRYLFLGER